MSQPNEQFERQIAEFVGGTLEEPTRSEVENRLLTDAEARLLATQYAHLDAHLRASRAVPAIDFDALAGRISSAIDAEDAHVPQPIRLPTGGPAQSSGHSFWRKRVAVAAAAVVGATVAAVILSGREGPLSPPRPQGELVVVAPAAEAAATPGKIEITIGPSQALVARGMTAGLTDEIIVKRPSRVVISAADAATPTPASDERLY
jgi:anti-sigma-K factor RskA